MTCPIITDHNGIERKLGYKKPSDDDAHKKRRAASQDISSVTPLIPQSQWTECDYVTNTPKTLILDQGQLGACVAFSCIGANARQRYFRDGQVVVPSAFYVYDQINGGSDNGAVITDAQDEMVTGDGAPPLALYPSCKFRSGLKPSTNLWYKEDVAIKITSSVDAATALISLGAFPQMPVNAGVQSFNQFTPEGIVFNGVAPSGPDSDHSIYYAGLKKINGKWYFILVNSWNLWGPFGLGWCYCPVAALDNPASTDDAWVHLSVLDPDVTAPIPSL